MKPAALFLPILLAACASTSPDTATPDLRDAQAAACTAATASHIARPASVITTAYAGGTATGLAIFTLQDDARIHTCEVDADLTIHAIRHPQE